MLRPVRIRYYVAAMESRGFEPEAVLRGSGITARHLADPAALVDRGQCERVIANMIGLTRNPALGLEIGSYANISDFGAVAYALLSSSTMRQANSLWKRFHNLVGFTVEVDYVEHEGWWEAVYDTSGIKPSLRHFCTEELVTLGQRLGGALGNNRFTIRQVSLDYAAPEHAAQYARYLPCPVHFGAGRTAVAVQGPPLDGPLRGADPEFNALCVRHCAQIKRNITGSNPLASKLRSLILARPGALPTPDEAAASLGMSARSLRRHLSRQNTSYHMLADDIRLELASEYLRAEHLSAKEVGYLVGFRSVTAFRRAFKAWTGATVQQFLESQGAAGADDSGGQWNDLSGQCRPAERNSGHHAASAHEAE